MCAFPPTAMAVALHIVRHIGSSSVEMSNRWFQRRRPPRRPRHARGLAAVYLDPRPSSARSADAAGADEQVGARLPRAGRGLVAATARASGTASARAHRETSAREDVDKLAHALIWLERYLSRASPHPAGNSEDRRRHTLRIWVSTLWRAPSQATLEG